MILKNLFLYLLIVSTSENSINRKRTFDSVQNGPSLQLQNYVSIEDQPLYLRTKRIKPKQNLPTESSTISNEDVSNLNDENVETTLIGAFKKLLIGTLNVLNSVFCIYERRLLDLSKCKELELGNLKMQVDRFVEYLQQSENIISYRNLHTESAFTRYYQSLKPKPMPNGNSIRQTYKQLVGELERTSIQNLFYSLFFSVKESGSAAPTGVITCALYMLGVYKTDSIHQFKKILIYLILAHKDIVLVNCHIDSALKVKNIKRIKDSIHKKMCGMLFPETKFAKYEEISHLTEKFNKKNYWFNEPSVILLMQYINVMDITKLDYIFIILTNCKATGNKKMNDLVSDFYLHMFILFRCETVILNQIA